MDDFLDDDLGGAPEGRRRRRARSGLPAGTSAAAMRVRRLRPPCTSLSIGCSQESSRPAHSLDETVSCRSDRAGFRCLPRRSECCVRRAMHVRLA